MSDNWIILIPDSAEFVPTEAAQQDAVTFFKYLAPTADEIKAEATANIQFVDCGGNFEKIVCPACGEILDPKWWGNCMDRESKANYPLKPLELPCCHSKRSVAELRYEWQQGFARFSLEAMNPNVDLSAEDLKKFESVLGCRLKKILRHL